MSSWGRASDGELWAANSGQRTPGNEFPVVSPGQWVRTRSTEPGAPTTKDRAREHAEHRARGTRGTGHRAPSTGHRTPSTEHGAHGAPSTEHRARASNTEHRALGVEHRGPGAEHRVPRLLEAANARWNRTASDLTRNISTLPSTGRRCRQSAPTADRHREPASAPSRVQRGGAVVVPVAVRASPTPGSRPPDPRPPDPASVLGRFGSGPRGTLGPQGATRVPLGAGPGTRRAGTGSACCSRAPRPCAARRVRHRASGCTACLLYTSPSPRDS